jgi:valyl-tRNA synthetase
MEGEYRPEENEQRWQRTWTQNKTYSYTQDDQAYVIDTPPPTVSGNLHMGHLYQHTLQDILARYKRLKGNQVFFPFGYDDNGIASERLTERELGIEHSNYQRSEFQKKCRQVCESYEEKFTSKMQSLGFSMDWTNTYKTISPQVQRKSQLSFIDLYEKDREYREKSPTIWCPECETAISQVEMEDEEHEADFVDIEFDLASEGGVVISTTRPELLPACVALFVHPEGDHSHLEGSKAQVPLFGHQVPIIEDERVEKETGTGAVMCCTFGDQTDIEWYKAYDLDLRVAIDKNGLMTDLAGGYEGMTTSEAREEMVDDLESNNHIVGKQKIDHTVRVHERCDEPVEFLVSKQWYIKILDKKDEYLEAGNSMDWFPEKMKKRYDNWVEGLEWDWIISRQRDSGIPFPVWYCSKCGETKLAEKDRLPVDPTETSPRDGKCHSCGHDRFEPETDVLDTWATSSLTPLINADWGWDTETEEYEIRNQELYKSDLRPQGHDIISFWLFNTVVKCLEHTGQVPFESVMINGHVLNEQSEKMSKSKGNYTPPSELIEEYSVDAIRYWCASATVGNDFPLDHEEINSGERLLRKIWNSSKLVNDLTGSGELDIEQSSINDFDKWMIDATSAKLDEIDSHMQNMEFSKARRKLRSFYWHVFCDDYLEVAKQRLNDSEDISTHHTLNRVHKALLVAWEPFIPHLSHEVLSNMYVDTPVHQSGWPDVHHYGVSAQKGENVLNAISALRDYKTSNGMSLNESLQRVEVIGDLTGMEEPVSEAMHVNTVVSVDPSDRISEKISGIDLDYESLGPKYGDQLQEIEEGIEKEGWNIDSGHLRVNGHMIKPENFDLEKKTVYEGDGDLIEHDNGLKLVVKQS